jgi:hypothetical protein
VRAGKLILSVGSRDDDAEYEIELQPVRINVSTRHPAPQNWT